MSQPRLHILCRGHVLVAGKRLCDECKRGNRPLKPCEAAPEPRLPTAKLTVQIVEEEDSMSQFFSIYLALNVSRRVGWQPEPVNIPLQSYSAAFDSHFDEGPYPVSLEEAEPVDVEAWIMKWRQVAQSYGFSFEVNREVREWIRVEKKNKVEK